MITDSEIKKNVEHELQWDPEIVATDLAVSVKDKVVELTGYARSYTQKVFAERDAKRVAGVLGVANDVVVRLGTDVRLDSEVAREAVAALKAQLPEFADFVTTVVENGYVKLEGRLTWDYQRRHAENVVRRVRGVKGLVNHIVLKPTALPVEVKHKIEEALKRSASVESSHIKVEANGGDVTLSGRARSWGERDEVERAAWMAPGVINVHNHIGVTH
jgi:osmotically-inducible protein OsmY